MKSLYQICVKSFSAFWNASDVYCPNGKSISTTHSVAGITRIVPLQRASSGPGRPRFDISEQQLMYLHSMGFTWVEIANLLGVSRMTIFRRRREFGQVKSVGDNI